MKTKKKRESMLEIYRGLPGEIYFLFIARAISCLGRFIAPVLALILTQKIGMDVGKAGMLVTLMIFMMSMNCYVLCKNLNIDTVRDIKYEYMIIISSLTELSFTI